jgi:type I restriction enzyme S subunit
MFYKETDFQNSPIGKIPKDWEVGDTSLINVLKGYAFSSEFFNGKKDGIPLIRIRDLGKKETESYYSGPYDPAYLVKKGDILISMDGEFNVRLWDGPEGLLNQRVCKVLSKEPTRLDNLFFFYELQKPLKMMESQISQTTVKHLLDRDLERIKIPLPPIEEQGLVVGVLGVVDSAIGLVDRVIWKTERLKKGLMQELLTKGIEHKEYKDTQIGKTPKTWQIVKLGEILADVKYGTSMKANSNGQGLPVLGIPNILGGKIDETNLRYVDLLESERRNLTLEDGDILLVRTNANPDYIGRCALFQNMDGTWLYASYLIRIRPNKRKVSPAYLVKFLQSEKARKQFLSIARTSAGNYNINSQGVRAVTVSLPSLPEQQRIAEILSVVDKKLEFEREEKAKLERIERGLMDLLLTGRVRIKAD